MNLFGTGVGVGAIAASALWWLYVRHLSGVTSDLKDAISDVKDVTAKVSTAGDQVASAVKSVAGK